MNNLSSYCGLIDARISASDKYLPVKIFLQSTNQPLQSCERELNDTENQCKGSF